MKALNNSLQADCSAGAMDGCLEGEKQELAPKPTEGSSLFNFMCFGAG